jgi:uncharacterized membrane protein
MPQRSDQVPGRWNRRQRDWGVILWISFLAACVGTFVLFALVDPERLPQAWVMEWQTGVRLVYGLGFAFCFGVAFAASWLTGYMIRTGPRRGHARGKGRQKPTATHDPADGNPDLEGQDW